MRFIKKNTVCVELCSLVPMSLMSLMSLVGGLLLTGCASPRIERTLADRPSGPGYKIENYYAVDQLPAELRRVVVLPVSVSVAGNDQLDPQHFGELLHRQLRRVGRFDVLVLDADVLREVIGQGQLAPHEPMPAPLVAYLKERDVDAVFQLSVTNYRPYRPFVVGINSRLFRLGEDSILWAVDELFRSSDKAVINSARYYALEKKQKRYPFGDSYAALRGPSLFSEFVLHTVLNTLPPVSGR